MQLYVEPTDVFAVEDKIKQLDCPTPKELWVELKGRFRTKKELGTVIDYFLSENKIILDKGHIVWIHNPKLSRLLHKRGYIVL